MITILVGKSASGKDTMMRKMLESGIYSPIVSYTTRPMREGEKNGREYNFISYAELQKLIEEGAIMESRAYDTLVNGIPDVWHYASPNVDPNEREWLAILDVNGASTYIDHYGADNVSIIVLDVSDEERERRAILRGSFDKTEWDRRKYDDDLKFSEAKLMALSKLTPNFKRIRNEAA